MQFTDKQKKEKALKRSLLILDAFFTEDLPSGLNEKIQGWLVSKEFQEEKDTILQEIWGEYVQYDFTPDEYAYASLKDLRIRLKFNSVAAPKRETVQFPKRILRIAAVIIPFIAILSTIYYMTNTVEEAVMVGLVQTEVVLLNTNETRKHVLLPDSSEIWLSQSGKISYIEADFLNRRIVKLDGEAYFSVVKQNGKPFTVTSKNISVHVLGTEFNIKAYDNAETNEVSLAKGSVEVEAKGKTVLLKPEEKLTYHINTEDIHIQNIVLEKIAPWKYINLNFDHTPLHDVFHMLSVHYDVVFSIDNQLSLDHAIRVHMDENDTLSDILFVLQHVVGTFKYEIQENNVIISPK